MTSNEARAENLRNIRDALRYTSTPDWWWIANNCGCSYNTVYRLATGREKYVSVALADRILTFQGAPHVLAVPDPHVPATGDAVRVIGEPGIWRVRGYDPDAETFRVNRPRYRDRPAAEREVDVGAVIPMRPSTNKPRGRGPSQIGPR